MPNEQLLYLTHIKSLSLQLKHLPVYLFESRLLYSQATG